MRIVVADPTICVACRSCEYACAGWKMCLLACPEEGHAGQREAFHTRLKRLLGLDKRNTGYEEGGR
jgi:Fe-S-cluster-containing dehydrogenase component